MRARWPVSVDSLSIARVSVVSFSVALVALSVALAGTAAAKPYTPPPPPPPGPPPPPPPPPLSWHPPPVEWHPPAPPPAPSAVDHRGFTMSIDLGINELNFRDPGGAGVIGETLSTELAVGAWLAPRAALLLRVGGAWGNMRRNFQPYSRPPVADRYAYQTILGPELHVTLNEILYAAGGVVASRTNTGPDDTGIAADVRVGLDLRQRRHHAIHFELAGTYAHHDAGIVTDIGLRLGWQLF